MKGLGEVRHEEEWDRIGEGNVRSGMIEIVYENGMACDGMWCNEVHSALNGRQMWSTTKSSLGLERFYSRLRS